MISTLTFQASATIIKTGNGVPTNEEARHESEVTDRFLHAWSIGQSQRFQVFRADSRDRRRGTAVGTTSLGFQDARCRVLDNPPHGGSPEDEGLG